MFWKMKNKAFHRKTEESITCRPNNFYNLKQADVGVAWTNVSLGLSEYPDSHYSRVLIVRDNDQSYGISVNSLTQIVTVHEYERVVETSSEKKSF